MGKQLEAVEMDKAMLEQSYAALHSDMKSLKQTVRDKNKRVGACTLCSQLISIHNYS